MEAQDAEVVSRIPGPRILPFVKKEPEPEPEPEVVNAVKIAEEFMKVAKDATKVVILHENAEGELSFLTDQRDIANMNLFMDKAKLSLLMSTL